MHEKIITPNYERMRGSFIYSVQDTWNKFCRANHDYLTSMWFDQNGKLVMNNTEKYKKEMDKTLAAFEKAQQDLVDFDKWVETQKQSDIFMKKLMVSS